MTDQPNFCVESMERAPVSEAGRVPGLVTLAVLIVGLALTLALGEPQAASRCVEDAPCWIPAMDGNTRGSLDIFHPFAR